MATAIEFNHVGKQYRLGLVSTGTIDESQYGISRDALFEKMKANNVLGRRYFYPLITDFEPYKDIPSANPANLPVANKIANQVICLPMHNALSEEDVRRVVECIRVKE